MQGLNLCPRPNILFSTTTCASDRAGKNFHHSIPLYLRQGWPISPDCSSGLLILQKYRDCLIGICKTRNGLTYSVFLTLFCACSASSPTNSPQPIWMELPLVHHHDQWCQCNGTEQKIWMGVSPHENGLQAIWLVGCTEFESVLSSVSFHDV